MYKSYCFIKNRRLTWIYKDILRKFDFGFYGPALCIHNWFNSLLDLYPFDENSRDLKTRVIVIWKMSIVDVYRIFAIYDIGNTG